MYGSPNDLNTPKNTFLELVQFLGVSQVKEGEERRESEQGKVLLDLVILFLDNFQNTK